MLADGNSRRKAARGVPGAVAFANQQGRVADLPIVGARRIAQGRRRCKERPVRWTHYQFF